ncbi:hypothetical protein FALBO_15808 [Fusarium albosuccineum]|uniref:Uncharacterized protein n=1 Tax=Fusarium albosuccineum TaxID=1237068 RepID=A0A8H4KQ73_9HYPO|nr:hypothetical protein FALBO_15808 [Fusarium albosuccineum]
MDSTGEVYSATQKERSREYYQERAYISASRRSDRSIEARLESAHKASKIHKRRTGKSLRVTRDAVLRQELFEEDQRRPSCPRKQPHVQTRIVHAISTAGSKSLSEEARISAVKAKTQDEWRNSEINRLFAEAFPQFAQLFEQQMPVLNRLVEEPASQVVQQQSEGKPDRDSRQNSHLESIELHVDGLSPALEPIPEISVAHSPDSDLWASSSRSSSYEHVEPWMLLSSPGTDGSYGLPGSDIEYGTQEDARGPVECGFSDTNTLDEWLQQSYDYGHAITVLDTDSQPANKGEEDLWSSFFEDDFLLINV